MNSQLVLCESEDSLPEDGILFVRFTNTLTSMVRLPLIALSIALIVIAMPIQNSFGTFRTLDFTIYQDGSTHVFQQIEADPLEPDFTVILFGNAIENFVAEDENGFLLTSQIQDNTAVIETFGANTISIDYDTFDLISKNGKIWSFDVHAPTDFTLLMPKKTVIVGMSTFPESLEILDEQSLLTLPKGPIELDYFFGVSGSALSASNTIDETRNFIEQIKNDGISTPLSDAKLTEALTVYDEGRFIDAEKIANEAKSIAVQEQTLGTSTSSNDNSLLLIAGAVAVAGGISVAVIAKRKKQIIEKTESVPKQEFVKSEQKPLDKETIFRVKSNLREDDKELITFIFENGGQAYESELRKKFLQPRTTMWRAVKRLEREGIVKIEKKELQNLVRITDEFMEDGQ